MPAKPRPSSSSVRQAKGLDGLKDVKRHLAQQAAERKAHQKALAGLQVSSPRSGSLNDRELFARTVGEVVPVHTTRVLPRPSSLPALPLQREKDEAAVLIEALSDEMDVESLLETDDALSFRRSDVGPDVLKRLRRGVWAIQAQLDLHGLRRDEARDALNHFFKAALQQRLRCVRVVHGKGHGSPGRTPVLKDKVKRWLVQKEEVMAYVQARAADGGHGALVVLLRA